MKRVFINFFLTGLLLTWVGNVSFAQRKQIFNGVKKAVTGDYTKTISAAGKEVEQSAAKVAKQAAAASAPKIPSTVEMNASVTTLAPLMDPITIKPFQIPSISQTIVRPLKRPIIGFQTTVLGTPIRTAVERAHRWGALPEKHEKMPNLLPKKVFSVSTFADMSYAGSILPPLPIRKHPFLMYRGMGLNADGVAIRNILENGLLLKDVGLDSNNLITMYAGNGHGAAIREASKLKFTNLTDDPSSAFHYAQRNITENRILVIVSVKDAPRGSIVRIQEDIPPSQIREMIALLRVEGRPTWCRIEIAEEGFRVTPYQNIVPPSLP